MGKASVVSCGLAPLLLLVSLIGSDARAADPDWSEDAPVGIGGRPNPHAVAEGELGATIRAGRAHALAYPVEVTGALVPVRPFRTLLESGPEDPLRQFVSRLVHRIAGFDSTDDAFAWLGLQRFPEANATGIYALERPPGLGPGDRAGYGVIHRGGADGFTFSCAACHSANLFGRTVLGLTNRFPRANETFVLGKRLTEPLTPAMFAAGTGASRAESRMYGDLRRNIRAVGVKKPLNLGLDTSLAQVALSLSRREADAYATKSAAYERAPRPDLLDDRPADSKPAVWWNLKYKDRWLSDGSVVSGNPILTNLLWNEVGRGTDLRELDAWFARSSRVIEELTTAVFSTEAPRYTDFFPAERVDLAAARRGERIFNDRCAKCHGTYEKAWNRPDAAALTAIEALATTLVRYPERTKVVDVGTDPMRRLGMASLAEKLNPLEISRRNGIRIVPQPGYVPPPLVGIWARWPYFHNNSAPTLCAVLSQVEERPRTYRAGEALDPSRDFDPVCNGYPSGDAVPDAWRADDEALYDTTRVGMGNRGHEERMSSAERADVIVFLQTL